MPRDYQKARPEQWQRRPELTRDEAWIKDFLHHGFIARVGHISNGQPFITPTNYWYDEPNQQVIFHSNLAGRIRSNLQANPRAVLEVSEVGRLLPANTALEFSIQFRSVMVYGNVKLLQGAEAEAALYGLIGKYFPRLTAGQEYRPITSKELASTSVYALQIESWTGKENWMEQADQLPDWPPLPKQVLDGEF